MNDRDFFRGANRTIRHIFLSGGISGKSGGGGWWGEGLGGGGQVVDILQNKTMGRGLWGECDAHRPGQGVWGEGMGRDRTGEGVDAEGVHHCPPADGSLEARALQQLVAGPGPWRNLKGFDGDSRL